MKNLAAYISEASISQRAFADMIGVHPSVVSRFVNGSARPGLDLAVKIERITLGSVSVESWVSPEAGVSR